MSHFAVIVTIELKPGTSDDFRRLILENAAAAKRDEPGCRRFDVLAPEGGGETFIFYEEYTDAEAFATHRQTPHFKKYSDATAAMIAQRAIRRCSVIS